jgi:hypothetical protein
MGSPDCPSQHVAAGWTELPCIRQANDKSPAVCGSSTKSAIAKAATTKSVQDDAKRGETPQ